MKNKLLYFVAFVILQLQTSVFADTSTTQNSLPNKEEKPIVTKESEKLSLTLEDILNASKEIAEQKPSKRISGATSKEITLNGSPYEIRIFFFEDVKGSLPKDMNFRAFAKSKDLLSQPAKVMDHGYGPVIFFSAPEKISKEEGIFYLLAIRSLKAS